MVLSPGEIFQHSHADASITMLVEGKVDLEIAGASEPLVVGQETPVGANTPHVLVNRGEQIAIVKCVHLYV